MLVRHPILSPGGLFSFGLLDGLSVRLRRPYLREAPAGFGLERLAMAFMNNPDSLLVQADRRVYAILYRHCPSPAAA
jgi:hypothetical protein